MPFITLNNSWSDLALQYNKAFNNKPEIPAIEYTGFDDGLIRGGAINVGISTVRDTARIGKFFASTKGVLFITKQVGLQLSNPLLEQISSPAAPTTNQNVLDTIKNTVNNLSNKNSPTRIYNLGINTLAQVAVNAIGGHIIRHGLTPIGGVGFLNGSSLDNIIGYNYERIAATNAGLITNNVSDRTSIALKNNRLLQYYSKIRDNPANDTTPILLQEYNGGAASVYGIGKTQIFTTNLKTDFKNDLESNQKDNKTLIPLNYGGLNDWFNTYRSNTETGNINTISNLFSQVQSKQTIINEQLAIRDEKINAFLLSYNKPKSIKLGGSNNQLGFKDSNNSFTNIRQLQNDIEQLQNEIELQNEDADFSVYQGVTSNNIGVTPVDNFKSKNIQSRIGTSTSKYGPNNIKPNYKVDSINVINVTDSATFYGNSVSAKKFSSEVLTEYSDKVSGYYGRDIIKFRFEFLNNDIPIDNNGINTDVLAFRAYIDDFQDGMNAKWNPYRYMGRGEEFYVYDGFTRDISVAFTIFAHSPEEMKPIYTKLNYLMSTFAPDYSSANKMRGNIGYLTVGDYLYRQPGVFTDIKLNGLLDSHWEIALGQPEGDINDIAQYEVPKHIKVNMSFKPIHTFLPRKVQKDKYSETPFITRDKKAYGLTSNKYLD